MDKKNLQIDEKIRQLSDKYGYKIGNETILDYYYNLPIEEKTVLVVGLGNSLRGSMLYVLQALQEEQFRDYKVYVRVSEETKKNVERIIEKYNFNNAYPVLDNKEYNRYLSSAKYLITEVRLPMNWIKKEGQVYINIWHGTPLKCLGLDKNTKNIHKDGRTQKNFIEADYLLYPNDYTREHMLDAYKVRNLTKAKALMCGYPRSSILLDEKKSKKVHKILAPNGEEVFAYMPTWRDGRAVEDLIAEMQFMLDSVDKNLMDHQILYVNLHHKIGDSLDYSKFKHIQKFPADMDNYEVLAGTDILFTDYSSVFFDFLVTQRKIVLYCPDIDEYFKKRGTYIDLKAMPFAKAYTNAQLIKELNTPKNYNDDDTFKEFCAYDSIDNARNLCKIFADDTEGLNLVPIDNNGKDNVIIYSEYLQDSESTDLLRKYVKLQDQSECYNLYISCFDTKVDENKASAYPLLSDYTAFGISEGLLLTAAQKNARAMYHSGKLSFDNFIKLTENAYGLENKRLYGSADFKTAVLFETDDPERILSYAQMSCKKYFFIQESMITVIKEGNQFLKDACSYMIEKCGSVYVISEKLLQQVEEVFGKEISSRTILLTQVAEIEKLVRENH